MIRGGGFLLSAAAVLLAAGCRPSGSVPPAEPFTASASLSTNVVLIGEPVELTLDVLHPAGAVVAPPELARDPEIRVRGRASRTEPVAPEVLRTQYHFVLAAFRTGAYVVCTNAIAVRTGPEDVRMVPFPFLTLEVQSVLSGDDPDAALEPAGLKDFARWPDPFPRWVPALLLVGLLAFLAAVLATRLWRCRTPRAPTPVPAPPAHVTALAALERLRRKQYIEQGLFEPFYVEVSAIARYYLEQRFAIHAPELTTEELLGEAARDPRLSPAHRDHCRRFLEHCDLVKFARHEPGAPEMEGTLDAVEQLIRETMADAPAAAAAEARAA